ncbi:MAG: type II secretion system protein [Candidatus Paceibacterota bacterium]|jgi:prepilin-type N-terminal cleavage/methylation domain-containing protein
MSNKNLKNKGFTLVELMVVVVIIGILSAVVLANLSSVKSKSRDAKRIADVGQIQLALEQYFGRCHEYPGALSVGSSCSDQSGNTVSLSDFISVIPTPSSQAGQNNYQYTTKQSGLDYYIMATLENDNEVLTESLPYDSVEYPDCYGSSYPKNYCVGPR